MASPSATPPWLASCGLGSIRPGALLLDLLLDLLGKLHTILHGRRQQRQPLRTFLTVPILQHRFGLFRCPQIHRHEAGGNYQLQRGCKLTGAARGTSAFAANSRYVTPAYVAATQTVPSGSISWEYTSQLDLERETQNTTAEAKSKSKSKRSTR